MKIEGEAKLLRIFVGESDKIGNVPVYEKIVLLAREKDLAGATVLKGIMGYGKNSAIHTSKILVLSEDMPLIVEIVDESERIEKFLKEIDKLFEESRASGLITVEKAHVIKY
jgi:PII-like signaling protein